MILILHHHWLLVVHKLALRTEVIEIFKAIVKSSTHQFVVNRSDESAERVVNVGCRQCTCLHEFNTYAKNRKDLVLSFKFATNR